MKIKNKFLNVILDTGTLFIALIIDLALNITCMIIIAPAWIEMIGFIGLAIIIVLFGVRAFLKGGWYGMTLWALFALTALFFDLSFVLEATKAQSEKAGIVITIDNDTELPRLLNEKENAQKQYEELVDQQRISFNRATLDNLAIQIVSAEEKLKSTETKYDERLHLIESGRLTKQLRSTSLNIRADDIFYAIPNAVKEGRIIPLFVFLAIFIGLQLSIITAATSSTEQTLTKKKVRDKIEHIDVGGKNWGVLIDAWVDVIWRNEVPSIPSESDFFEILRLSKKTMHRTEYNRIMRAAHHQKVIIDGTVVITDKVEAKKKILVDKVLN